MVISMEVLSRENISPTEALKRLSDEEEENLERRQRSALEHLKKHVTVEDEETFEELRDELKELDTFTDDQIIKVIDVLPQTEQEVRTLFSKERIKLDDSDIQQVLDFAESVDQS